MRLHFGLLAAAVLLSGCTTTLKTAQPADGISRGYSYELPRIGYDAEIKRTLTRCPDAAGQEIRFDVAATGAARYTPGEVVLIDYMALGGAMKTSDLALTKHPNGMLKSINLTIDDRTGAVIGEGVKAAVGIAKIAIGLPGGGAVSAGGKAYDGTEAYLRCSEAARTSLHKLPELKTAIKVAETKSKQAAKAYDDLLTASKQGKPAAAGKLAGLAAAARDAQEGLDKAKKDNDEEAAKLLLLHRVSIDIDDDGASEIYRLEMARDAKPQPSGLFEVYYPFDAKHHFVVPLTADLKPDFARAVPKGYAGDAAGKAQVETDRAKMAADSFANLLVQLGQANVALSINRLGGDATAATLPKASTCDPSKADCGILYRTRSLGRIRLCTGAAGPANAKDMLVANCRGRVAGDPAILVHEERLVPQFGRLMSLPLKNGPFENNVLAAQFSEDGQVTDFSYKKPVAQAQAALASANEVIGGLSEVIVYGNGRELRRLQAQKAILDAKLSNQEVADKLSLNELEQLQAQKSVIEAQILLADAQTRAQPSAVTQTNNEVLLIEARIKKAQKLLELKKVEKELSDLEAGAGGDDAEPQ